MSSSFIGPYRIDGELGRGAMAVVWKGYDPSLDRVVAIKEAYYANTLSAEVITQLGQRFLREAKAMAKLEHPGIVQVFAAEMYDNRPVIVMEYLEGISLAKRLEQGSCSVPEAIHILRQLLSAVSYAHSKGVVHRDIKPDNIFLSSDGRVTLVDFGIAYSASSSVALTGVGTVMGTPGYMSPEQVLGQRADERSDLFSIGVVGYEMIAGINPFGAHPNAVSTDVMGAIIRHIPPKLPELVNGGLGFDLASALECAMQKDSALRPADADRFLGLFNGETLITAADAGIQKRLPENVFVAAADGIASSVHYDVPPIRATNPNVVWAVLGVLLIALIGGIILFSDNSDGALSPASTPIVQSVSVPNVIGLNQADAEQAIKAAGYLVDIKTRDLEGDEGEVIEQDPTEGSAPKGSTIFLTVSSGTAMVEVPDITNDENWEERLDSAGLQWEMIPAHSDTDWLWGQTPEPGEMVPVGTVVTFYRQWE